MLKKILGKVWRKTPAFIRKRVVRLPQTKFIVSVGAVVTNDEGKILLLDHVLRPASGWGIPGGFIKAFEAPEDALQRELQEEIGLKLETITLRLVRNYGRHLEMLYHATTREKGEVSSFEINRIGWFDLAGMPPEMHRFQRQVIGWVISGEDGPPPSPRGNPNV